LNKDRGLTLIIVTHDPAIAAQTQRVIYLRDGLIEEPVSEPIAAYEEVQV
jgi:putative ABC transport system ATP-binding protein